MLQSHRELLVARITSGQIRCKLPSGIYIIEPLSPAQKYLIEEHYEALLEEYSQNSISSEEELTHFLINKKLWKPEWDVRITKLKEEIEDLKVDLFQSWLKVSKHPFLKACLTKALGEFSKLHNKKNQFSHLTSSGVASIAKLRMTIGLSLTKHGKRLFSEETFWDTEDTSLLDNIVNHYNQTRISDAEFRDIARNEPWRSYWLTRKACPGVFEKPSILLTDEQRQLVYWSLLYDNVYEHPDCPVDDLIEDDDALDGFLINEKRKKDAERGNKTIDSGLSQKVKESDEIFIVADSEKHLKMIEAQNDEMAKAKKQSREKVIRQKGVVNDLELPDVKKRLQLEINQKTTQNLTGGK